MRLLLVVGFLALCTAVPVAADYEVDTPIPAPISPQESPAVVSGSHGYLAVWRDYRGNGDTYATRIDLDGVVLDPLGIRISAGQGAIAVSAVRDGYVIAQANGCNGIETIFMNFDGVLSAPAKVSGMPGICVPDLGLVSNGETMLLEWGAQGALLDLHGGVIRAPLQFGSLYRTAVATNGSNYLLVSLNSVGVNGDVSGLPISGNGDIGASRFIGSYLNVTGLAVASDGTNYLVATTGSNLSLQRVDPDAKTAGALQLITYAARLSYAPRMARNGSEYGIVYTTQFGIEPGQVNIVRAQADGTPVPPPVPGPIASYPQEPSFDIAPAHVGVGFLILSEGDDRVVTITIAQDVDLARGSLPPSKLLTLAAKPQTLARLETAAGRTIVLWLERSLDDFTLRARAMSSAGQPLSPAIDVAPASYAAGHSASVVYDGVNVIIGWADGTARIRRFTPDLTPIDAEPIVIAPANELTLAAANGITFACWRGIAGYTWTVLNTLNATLTPHETAFPKPQYNDRSAVATWNGRDFAVIWATATGPPPLQQIYPEPPDDIVGMRFTPDGTQLNDKPVIIAHLGYSVVTLDAAGNESTRYVAWIPNPYSRGIDQGVHGVPLDQNLTPVREPLLLSGGDAAESLAVSTLRAGFAIVWRALDPELRYVTTLKVRAVYADGSPAGYAALAPRETYYARGAIGVQSTGDALVVAYDAITYEPSDGGVARVFLDHVELQPERRRSVSRR